MQANTTNSWHQEGKPCMGVEAFYSIGSEDAGVRQTPGRTGAKSSTVSLIVEHPANGRKFPWFGRYAFTPSARRGGALHAGVGRI